MEQGSAETGENSVLTQLLITQLEEKNKNKGLLEEEVDHTEREHP
jgi:hypothetical protein